MSGGLAVLVTGSRDWPAQHGYVIEQAIAGVLERVDREALVADPPVLLHGGCVDPCDPDGGYVGADGIAHRYWLMRAASRGGPGLTDPVVYPAAWARYGRSAGPRRNAEMVRHLAAHVAGGGDGIVLGFPHGSSPGTRGCLKLARAAELTTVVVEGSDVIGRPPARGAAS